MIVEILISILIGISLAAPVGPTTIEVVKRGINGFPHGFLTGLGAAAADCTYLLLVFFGLSILFMIPVIKIIIWLLGFIVLVFLGISGIKDYFRFETTTEQFNRDNDSETKSTRWSFPAGYLVTVSNPLTIVFWIGIFGVYLSSVIGGETQFSVLALFYSFFVVVGVILWFFVLSLILGRGGRRLGDKFLKYVSPVCGIILIAFGFWFGYQVVTSLLITQVPTPA